MRHAAWARRAGSFATRFVIAVLLTAVVTATFQSVLAGRLAVRAMEREAVSRVVDVAAGAQARVAARQADRGGQQVDAGTDRADLAADVMSLAAERGVAGAEVVPAPPGDTTDVESSVVDGRHVLVVTVPVRLATGPVGLQVTLDGDEARTRSAALRHSLEVVFGLGALGFVPLLLLLGGRRLLRRHRDEVRLSGTDDLTGAGSRRAFPVDLEAGVRSAREDDQPLSVVLTQVTGLDAVSGALGRRRGDALLADVAALLAERHPHRVYRLGGDVFGVVLPGIAPEDAFLLADALRTDVADRLPPLGLTVGVAGLDERCTDAETLLIAADSALDEARSLGGNRVVGPGDAAFGLRWLANRPTD